ncbi:MAG: ribosome assembly RNA-binding protein YhbY [Clostridia bacterium]|nr:ribosome assembly RNA-binding protein YhbY [Clostridia bacterium]
MMTSKQRAYLRGQANTLDSIFQIGKTGLSDNLLNQLSEALEARELIKISVLETAPDTAKNLASKISNSINTEVIQVIGNKIILFRQKKKNSRYTLSN